MQFTELALEEVRKAMCVLMQHQLLSLLEEEDTHHPGTHRHIFQVDLEAVVTRLRFPRIVSFTASKFGPHAGAVAEVLLEHGILSLRQLLPKAAEQLNHESEDAKALEASVKRVFNATFKANYIVLANARNIPPPTASQDDHSDVHSNSTYMTEAEQLDTLWRINFEQFRTNFLSQACIDFIEKTYGNLSGAIVRVMFTHLPSAYTILSFNRPWNIPHSIEQLYEQLQPLFPRIFRAMDFDHFQTFLSALAESRVITPEKSEADPAEPVRHYTLNVKEIVKSLQKYSVRGYLGQKYSIEAQTLFALICESNYPVATHLLIDRAMLPSCKVTSALQQLEALNFLQKDTASADSESHWRWGLHPQFLETARSGLYSDILSVHCQIRSLQQEYSEVLTKAEQPGELSDTEVIQLEDFCQKQQRLDSTMSMYDNLLLSCSDWREY
ncbi:DNA-directed RNA polymerase III subunit RPC3 [Pelomyxa schiedti]|nr:DNA-directed RNA polymerase III subunit RPC3 [Pelomyxa schiedti]